jgi:hypothetical protein
VQRALDRRGKKAALGGGKAEFPIANSQLPRRTVAHDVAPTYVVATFV